METVLQRLAQCKQRVEEAASRSNRSAADITIVGITKQARLEDVAAAVHAGFFEIGENRVQEAEKKISSLRSLLSREDFECIRWHLVGHLQTNKAVKAARLFKLIHSVDSRQVAERLNAFAAQTHSPLDILLQVNISGEESKSGVSWTQAHSLLMETIPLPFVRVRGLMGIGPLAGDLAAKRDCFRRLREVFADENQILARKGVPELDILSMGMSDDYEIAVEEGATLIRIGRAIFGG